MPLRTRRPVSRRRHRCLQLRTFVATTIAGLSVLSVVAMGSPAGASPNIAIVVLDDWGWDSTDLDGVVAPGQTPDDLARTPHIAAVAAEGVTYRSFYTSSTCSPSRARLMTGLPGLVTGWGGNGIRETHLDLNHRTLPRALRDAGHATALFGKWHLEGQGANPPFCHPQQMGFETVVETRNIDDAHPYFAYRVREQCGPESEAPRAEISPGVVAAQYQPSYLVDRAIAWVDEQTAASRPWLVVLSPKTPHGGWTYPPHALLESPNPAIPAGTRTGARALARYTGDSPEENLEHVEYVNAVMEAGDHEIGRFLAAIDPATTTVVVVSDNGPSGAVVDERFHDPNRAKGTPYALGVRVPMFVAGPTVAPARRGTFADDLVDMTDLFRTLLETAGVDPAPAPASSLSFAHTLTGSTPPPDARRLVSLTTFRDFTRTVRFEERWREYRHAFATDGEYAALQVADGEVELYHLPSDPTQRFPLAEAALTPGERAARDALVARFYVTAASSPARDGIDGDGDGLVDEHDPGVAGELDPLETGFAPGCDDGRDDDGDGLVDTADPGCSGPFDPSEGPVACSNGLDDDGDGLADHPEDPDCQAPTDEWEYDEQACLATYGVLLPVEGGCDPPRLDSDGDGVPDHRDNCTLAANPGQHDTDRDGYGNACDGDFTQDGIVSGADFMVFARAWASGISDGRDRAAAADCNGDGRIGGHDWDCYARQSRNRRAGSLGGPGPSGLSCVEPPGRPQFPASGRPTCP